MIKEFVQNVIYHVYHVKEEVHNIIVPNVNTLIFIIKINA